MIVGVVRPPVFVLISEEGNYGVNNEHFSQVAYIGVLNDDDTLKIGIPLYVKVSGDMSAEQQKLMHEITTDMIRRYEKQISEYFQELKKEQKESERVIDD